MLFPELPDKRIPCQPRSIFLVTVQNIRVIRVFFKPELDTLVLIEAGKIRLQIPAQFVFLRSRGMGKIRRIQAPAFGDRAGFVELAVDQE